MLDSQKFFPSQTTIEGKTFYSYEGKELRATETKLHAYITSFQSLLTEGVQIFSPSEFQAIQTAAALIDALAKTRLRSSEHSFPSLELGHHAFNIFYKSQDSDEWNLQFANSAYLEKMGANLSDKIQNPAGSLMKDLYGSETINGFNNAAKNPQGGYTAQFIEMDNVIVEKYTKENGEEVIVKPAFFWYRKEFDHPDGGKIQVRIGMNGTELSPEQKIGLSDSYKLADILRTDDIEQVSYSTIPHALLIERINSEIKNILTKNIHNTAILLPLLKWSRMILDIKDDIVKNSPFPLTIVDNHGKIQDVSTAYSVITGYRVGEILKPGFFNKIYPGIEGRVVGESIAFYAKKGYYPEDVSFLASRGKDFSGTAQKNNLNIGNTMELIPSPYDFGAGTIRLNTARPVDAIPGLDDAAFESNGVSGLKVEYIIDEIKTEGADGEEDQLTKWLRDNT